MKILGWSSNGKKKGESGWEKVSVITMASDVSVVVNGTVSMYSNSVGDD